MQTYQFDAEMARLYGVDCAVLIWNFSFWIEHNSANGMHLHDGRYWTYNTVDALTKIFPFWTRAQIRRILKKLEDEGVIMTGNYNTSAYVRTTWYAFTDSFQQMHLSKSANGSCENGKCINKSIYNNIDIQIKNTDKENIPADGGIFEGVPKVKKPRKQRATSERVACVFADSRFSRYENFEAEFLGPEYEIIDIGYYFHAVADWSAQKGKKMKDWIATARNFMRRDMEKNQLHQLQHPGGKLSADAVKYLQEMGD